LEELKQSVWDCDGSKSPGPDGFNSKFYMLAWNFIANDLLDLANNFFKKVGFQKESIMLMSI
jgi:hypothetical protein